MYCIIFLFIFAEKLITNKKMTNIYNILRRLNLSHSFIYHLKEFLLENDIYVQFCISVKHSKCLKRLLAERYKFHEKYDYSDFFNIGFLWCEHAEYIHYAPYRDKWSKKCIKLIKEGKIKFF